MHFEAVIQQVWRYALGDHDHASLEAVITGVYRITWRQSMKGAPGGAAVCIS